MNNTVVVLGSGQYHRPFRQLGYDTSDTMVDVPVAIVFTGGTDVDPNFYGESRLGLTSIPDQGRDTYEASVFSAHKGSVPFIGICRGSQFLTVMNGGRLIQNVRNHGRDHLILCSEDNFNSSMLVTSTHHQMMYPFEVEHTLLAYAYPKLSHNHYQTGSGVFRPEMRCEPEVVLYPQSNSLAVQYHPEYMGENTQGYKYFLRLVEKLLSSTLY